MNSDVAFEILRYLKPIDRCRLRLINLSFNEGCLIWWRRSSSDIDIGRTIEDNRRRRSKILSFLRFVSKYCSSSVCRLSNVSIDDQLMDEISIDHFDELRSLFDNLESIELRCVQIKDYTTLAKFLKNFFESVKELEIVARYPMAIENWDGDESRLCASFVELNRLKSLHLREMELKGDLLTSLNPNLIELIIDRCPDIDEDNLATMSVWCTKLERLRLIDVDMSLDTFRQLCALPFLRTFEITLNIRLSVNADWLNCVCSNQSIENATIQARVDGSFGDLMDSCLWSVMITSVGDTTQSDDSCLVFCLALQNPNLGEGE